MSEIVIGRIGRPHGVNGAVRVRSYSGESEHFRSLTSVSLVSDGRSKQMRVLRVRVHHHTPVLELEGITTPEQARGYLHWDIVVHREAGAAKGRDEYYVSDLVGCDVVVDSQPAGRVISVIEAPQADLLEIELPDAGSPASNASGSESRRVLLPFMQVYVGAVDPEAGRIEVLERWLLD